MLPSGYYPVKYEEDMAIVRTKLQLALLVAGLLLLFCLPLVLDLRWLSFLNLTLIYAIAVLGLNILTGCCGQISIGHAAFMAVGAYTSGVLVTKLAFPFWIALPFAGIGAGVVGLIFGLPSLRIKGFYLVLATLAAQFIIVWIALHALPITGGYGGLPVPKPQLGPIVFNTDKSYFYIIAVTLVVMTFLAVNILRTKAGRAFVAIRDSDLSAELIGINIYYYKLLAFFVGCFYAGIAGCLLAHYMGFILPDQFTLTQSIWFLGMIIVGGMGSTLGAFLGTFFIRLLEQFNFMAGPWMMTTFPAIGTELIGASMKLVFGLVIVLFLIFEPRGLAHRWALLKSAYRLYPFTY